MIKSKKYLDYLFNPFEIVHSKKVLQVNPTAPPVRIDAEKINISIYEYNATEIQELKTEKIEDCYSRLSNEKISWINIDGINKNALETASNNFGIHPLMLEDILSIGQRPKMDEINGLIFCFMNMLFYNEEQQVVETEQISLILGNNYVISIQEDATKDVFNPLREKLKINHSKVRQFGADFLYYSLIDSIVDNFFVVMEKIADKILFLEEEIVRKPSKRTLIKINNIRKEMILVKRTIGPVPELIQGIIKSETDLIHERSEKYFKDVYDHIQQANELVENYRDLLISLHDLYMNNANLKMNETMKIMTIVTCLFAPATVIGGIFGMNLKFMPIVSEAWAFAVIVGIMILLFVSMLVYFRRKEWF